MLRVGKAKADVWPKTAPKKGENGPLVKGKPGPFQKVEGSGVVSAILTLVFFR